ncbi:MAG: circadian clock protein KaiB [Deltaproteobacteria bacterium]|nr:circadian clock protein KaiB [Deltaproteobacteria bacterium]
MDTSSEGKTKAAVFVFRLFVAGNEPHSKRAKDNFRKLCEQRIKIPYELEIVDVFDSFEIALENNIFLTPALMMVSPAPAVTVFGDLSDTEEVSKALRLAGDE